MSADAALIHGAEAQVAPAVFLGRDVLAKRRLPKPYRHEALDARLRDERTRDEANLLMGARRAGVPVPLVVDIDRQAATLLLEHIPGDALRHRLEEDDEATAVARLHHLGTLVARLHAAGLTHGDLTTSNVLVPHAGDPASLVLIDFGLGQATRELEPRGVDVHLLEEALEATDARAEALLAAFLAGYRQEAARHAEGDEPLDADAVFQRLEAIRLRGRYR